MPRRARFAYYRRLDAAGKRTYDRSDALVEVPLPDAAALRPMAVAVCEALHVGERVRVQRAAARLVSSLFVQLGVPPVDVQVLSSRPRNDYGELHGLYTAPAEVTRTARPRIQVWMRTAAHARVVADKSFLRTLLHEVCHHLDYHLHQLEDSLHTTGFYRREASLFHQLYETPALAPVSSAGVRSPRTAGPPTQPDPSHPPTADTIPSAQLSFPGLEPAAPRSRRRTKTKPGG